MNAPLEPEVVSAIETKARALYREHLDPIAERFEFEKSPPSSETTGLPMVLFIGNHSSGKSSFVNYLIGEDVQRTGIAPTDDGFTIITYGKEAGDKDGRSLVTNPELSWGELKNFGDQLVSHLKLREIPAPNLEGIAFVDSPGMIDAADTSTDRGYDFAGVVRWFAERADVILFLFDPDKPGTTGETVRVLTDSLGGLDHKLLLIFNKVDRFTAMRDFARAYGALCWNLSRAIPRKDLPHVYNTYLPVPDARKHGEGEDAIPLQDFDQQREEVKEEVRRAPYRRLDNVISRLYQYTRRLRVHATVLSQLSSERLRLKLTYIMVAVAIACVGGLLLYATISFSKETPWKWVGGISVGMILAVATAFGVYTWDNKLRERNLSLDALFERAYARDLTLGDQADDLRNLWSSVRDRVRRALDAHGNFPRLRRSDLRRLEKVLDTEVPAMRAKASSAQDAA